MESWTWFCVFKVNGVEIKKNKNLGKKKAPHLSAFNHNQTSSNNYGYTTYANLTPSQYQTQSLISYENIQKNYTTLQTPPTINKNTASAVSMNDSNTKI